MRTWQPRHICSTSLNTPGIISSPTVKIKKGIGKFRDELETHGIPTEEFVGLRPKMYSLLYSENNKTVEEKVTKGIAKHQTKDQTRTL